MTRIRKFAGDLLNWLNSIGSIVLAYALLNPSAGSDLLSLLPEKLKTPAALAIPALWFGVVQFAKVRAIKKGDGNAA